MAKRQILKLLRRVKNPEVAKKNNERKRALKDPKKSGHGLGPEPLLTGVTPQAKQL